VKRGTPNHPKTLALASLLGIPHLHAVGVLEAFWHWVGGAAPTGALGIGVREHLATAIGWPGESSALVDAFHMAGWLDAHPLHTWVVHDWSHHAPNEVHSSLAKKGRLFWDGEVPSTSGLKSDERPGAAELLAQALERFHAVENAPQSKDGPRPVHGLSKDGPREPLPLPFNGSTTAPPTPHRPVAVPGRPKAAWEDAEALSIDIALLVELGVGSWQRVIEVVTDGSAQNGMRRCQPALRVETMTPDHVTRSRNDVKWILRSLLRRGEVTEEGIRAAELRVIGARRPA